MGPIWLSTRHGRPVAAGARRVKHLGWQREELIGLAPDRRRRAGLFVSVFGDISGLFSGFVIGLP
jgi:hypothetical protein